MLSEILSYECKKKCFNVQSETRECNTYCPGGEKKNQVQIYFFHDCNMKSKELEAAVGPTESQIMVAFTFSMLYIRY